MSGLPPWAFPVGVAACAFAAWLLTVVVPAWLKDRTTQGAANHAVLGTGSAPDPLGPLDLPYIPEQTISLVERPIAQYLGVAIACAIWFVGGKPGTGVMVLAAWTGIVRLLRGRIRRSRATSEERFAISAIHSASRALRAGMPLAAMLRIVAQEAKGMTGRAFQEVIRRESLGEPLENAVRRVMLASEYPALRAFGLAVLVQITAGGNLADSSDRLARSLVERGRVRRRAKTLLTYGRIAANVLAVLPLVVVPLVAASIDEYGDFLLNRPAGNAYLALSAAMVVTGLIMVQRTCRIEAPGSGVAT